MSDKVSLPSSSYDEMVKIIKGYGNLNGAASLNDVAILVGMNRTVVSGNNKFLSESGIISGGNNKSATDLGAKLGRALDHNQFADAQACWKELVSSNEGIAGLVTTVRIKGGMSTEDLSAHILYVSGQNNTKANKTGANALVEILKASGLVELSDGKLVVAQPNGDPEISIAQVEESPVTQQENSTAQPQAALQGTNQQAQSTYGVATQSPPQIAINIQLHLPETDKPEVYESLFKALKDNLLS